jgi:hypothetical protein
MELRDVKAEQRGWLLVGTVAVFGALLLFSGLLYGGVRYVAQVDCKKRVASDCRRLGTLAVCPQLIAQRCSSGSHLSADWLLIYGGLGSLALAVAGGLRTAIRGRHDRSPER